MGKTEPSRERACGFGVHATIAEAIRCAERNLGVARGEKLQPYWGSMQNNAGLIVGWQCGSRRRWRLDDEYQVREGVSREPWGPHINEENFELPAHLAKTVHLIEKPTLGGDIRVFRQWRKWTSAGDSEK